ncbi:MAG: HD domain-containing protein [Lachnospiraceae bacterium]|nr:HD domain-containing protein [Lachnospiraceae bacterium]
MEYIRSKDIFFLMCDTLRLVDRRAMDHGSRVAYYLYKMLECKGGYEKFELADFVFMASLHDIGAYKTEDLNQLVQYECKETTPHATYGYLVFKYLSPLSELASVILYHHMDYLQMEGLDYEYKEIAAYLNLAEKVDIYSEALGDKFDMAMFEKQVGTVISKEALVLISEAIKKYDILRKVKKDKYKEELEDIIGYMLFSNEDKKKFLQMLMFCQGFKSETSVVDTVTCLCIAEIMGQKVGLGTLEKEQLYYGALLHDIGMLAMPKEIIDAPRSLTPEEYTQIKTHVHMAEKVLKDRMDEEVVAIVAAHHERCDGSGYPRGLREIQMNSRQEILQLADTVTALLGQRAYRPVLEKAQIQKLLRKDAAEGKYSRAMVKIFLDYYEDIIMKVNARVEEIMFTYRKLNQQYAQVLGRLK